MKRKTNLFYRNNNNDNKFITFSNYTEDLTATVLSTDWKMYPNKFICCKFTDTQSSRTEIKERIIEKLVKYYENKLAFARDNEEEFGENIYSLAWLFKALASEIEITYVGDVTERDYNGIYSDMYITIDSIKANQVNWEFSVDNDIDNEKLVSCEDTNYLYGWAKNSVFTGPDAYSDLEPEFDDGTAYSKDPLVEFTHEGINDDPIEFDIIIPLYVIMNVNPNTETDYIDETDLNEINQQIEDNTCPINIPMGIWFADKTITVERDTASVGSSWTLVLASQFKPFPYSNEIPDETVNNSNTDKIIDKTNNITFAQVLAAHCNVMDKYSEILKNMVAMSNRIKELETQVSLLSK